MGDDELIEMLNETRCELNSFDSLYNIVSVMFCDNTIPDLTHMWNLADFLCSNEQITEDEKIIVFQVLTKLESNDKCILGELPIDVY